MNELTRICMNFGPHMAVYISFNKDSECMSAQVIEWAAEFQDRWQDNLADTVIAVGPAFFIGTKGLDFDWVVLKYDFNHGPMKYEDVFPLQHAQVKMNGGLIYNAETGRFDSHS